MIKKIPLIVFLGLAAPVAAAGEQFSQLDADRNGTINQQEAQMLPELTEKWSEIDINRDGVVDEVEFARFEEVPQESIETVE
jgi:EF hand